VIRFNSSYSCLFFLVFQITMNNYLLHRIIDVNFNRAREATRVIEDYARFMLDDEFLTAGLRNIRHKLAQLLSPILSGRTIISARNIKDDIGKESVSAATTTSEVITANFKRLQESLRSLTEYTKTIKPQTRLTARQVSQKIEKLRFTAYDLEQQLSFHLHPGHGFRNIRLYVLVSTDLIHKPLIEIAKEIIRGGADAVQLREESMPDRILLDMARQIRHLTLRHRILFIVNDRLDIALLSNADGVHLGKDDIPIHQARKLLGPDKIIGATSHNIREALAAQDAGADYISVGPMFASPTKPHLTPAGLNYLKEVARRIKIPYVAIGGINRTNLPLLIRRHKKLFRYPLKIAISSSIIAQPNPTLTTRHIKKTLTK